MVAKKLFIFIFIISLLTGLNGCAPATPAVKNLSEAQQKLLSILTDELKLDVVLRMVGKTLYLYVPLEESILEFKSGEERPQKDPTAKDKLALKFIDVRFEDESFWIDYDVENSYAYSTSYGYTTPYTESFKQKQNSILAALYRSFGDLSDSATAEAKDKPPDFLVLIMADIKTGIESEVTMNLEDYMRVADQSLPYDEYAKRYVNKLSGWQGIIGDKEGKHVDFKELSWGNFLSRQIAHRINFKYNQSSFPPTGNTEAEIIKICYETLVGYEFVEFKSLILHNLFTDKELKFTSAEVLATEYKGDLKSGL